MHTHLLPHSPFFAPPASPPAPHPHLPRLPLFPGVIFAFGMPEYGPRRDMAVQPTKAVPALLGGHIWLRLNVFIIIIVITALRHPEFLWAE